MYIHIYVYIHIHTYIYIYIYMFVDVRLGGAFLINSEGDTFINMYIYICI
jgi:hypothetical protein